jgi:hypothetical protein
MTRAVMGIQYEVRQCAKEALPFTIAVDDADFHKLHATVFEPLGTPSEDWALVLLLSLAPNYP